jgi:protoheme ferro-lyase
VTTSKKRVGIVLFQLGGPDSLDTVEPFLRNLFLDPDIIPLGPANFIRGPLARYIAKKRTPAVASRYAMIGRRSPIAILTERQRVKLVRALEPYIEPVAVTATGSRSPKTPLPLSSGPGSSTNSCCFRFTRTIPTPRRSAA